MKAVKTGFNIKFLIMFFSLLSHNISVALGDNEVRGLSFDSSVTLQDEHFSLTSDLSLKSVLTFSGSCVFDGNGNHLMLDAGSQINIAPGSHVLFKNIVLVGAQGQNIQCLDSFGSVSFSNVELVLVDDFKFSTGFFDVNSVLKIIGNGYRFSYGSDQISTINVYSHIVLGHGLIFSYDPLTQNQELLHMADRTAGIKLDGATLHAVSGLRLTKGYLLISARSYLVSDASEKEQGIKFGDGINRENNVAINIVSLLELRGSISYEDV